MQEEPPGKCCEKAIPEMQGRAESNGHCPIKYHKERTGWKQNFTSSLRNPLKKIRERSASRLAGRFRSTHRDQVRSLSRDRDKENSSNGLLFSIKLVWEIYPGLNTSLRDVVGLGKDAAMLAEAILELLRVETVLRSGSSDRTWRRRSR